MEINQNWICKWTSKNSESPRKIIEHGSCRNAKIYSACHTKINWLVRVGFWQKQAFGFSHASPYLRGFRCVSLGKYLCTCQRFCFRFDFMEVKYDKTKNNVFMCKILVQGFPNSVPWGKTSCMWYLIPIHDIGLPRLEQQPCMKKYFCLSLLVLLFHNAMCKSFWHMQCVSKLCYICYCLLGVTFCDKLVFLKWLGPFLCLSRKTFGNNCDCQIWSFHRFFFFTLIG